VRFGGGAAIITVVVVAERRIERNADGVEPIPERHCRRFLGVVRHIEQAARKSCTRFDDQAVPLRQQGGLRQLGADRQRFGFLALARYA